MPVVEGHDDHEGEGDGGGEGESDEAVEKDEVGAWGWVLVRARIWAFGVFFSDAGRLGFLLGVTHI